MGIGIVNKLARRVRGVPMKVPMYTVIDVSDRLVAGEPSKFTIPTVFSRTRFLGTNLS